MKTLLISIHPPHSQNILAGRKSIELRKRPFKQKDGSPVFNYLLIYQKIAVIPRSFQDGDIRRDKN